MPLPAICRYVQNISEVARSGHDHLHISRMPWLLLLNLTYSAIFRSMWPRGNHTDGTSASYMAFLLISHKPGRKAPVAPSR